MTIIDDVYGAGNMVRRWGFSPTGYPICIGDGLTTWDALAPAALQANAGVRTLVTSVEAYEAAQSVPATIGQPPQTNPDYAGSQALVAAASTITVAHAKWRAGDQTQAAQVQAQFSTLAAQALAVDPRPVPASIPLWVAKFILAQQPAGSGTLLDAADAAITAANSMALTAVWTNGNSIDRDSPSIAELGAGLGLTSMQVDNLFRQAAAVVV